MRELFLKLPIRMGNFKKLIFFYILIFLNIKRDLQTDILWHNVM